MDSEKIHAIEHDPILFGTDETQGIVSVEFVAPNRVKIYRRIGEETRIEEERHQPFAWSSEQLSEKAIKLEGRKFFKYLQIFETEAEFDAVKKEQKDKLIALRDLSHQYLLASGRTLFKGMTYGDLRRMQIDIETHTPEDGSFSNANKHPLLAIAMSDSTGWEKLLVVDDPKDSGQERAVLEEFVKTVSERDPDVIEGHNIFNFDLPYLEARARRNKVGLSLGRDGSEPRSWKSNIRFAERPIQYRKHFIHGRHVVDTWFLVQHYDITARTLESHGLKVAARHFGIAEEGREVLKGREITEAHKNRREIFPTYALQDVRETRALAAVLSPAWFTQTQIFPYNYQEVIIRGSATRINSLFLREYLRQKQSIPVPPSVRSFAGALTDISEEGVQQNVWHGDIASLYPSVMVAYKIYPKSDVLGIFGTMLENLRSHRLMAKAAMQTSSGAEKTRFDVLQSTFKILINSFYGYLGFPQANFADYDAAESVTAKGRELLQGMIEWLKGCGAKIIEADTDGIYFTPPSGTDWNGLREELSDTLPEGIEVEFDARYRAMFSYKKKNYALLDDSGRVFMKGGALKSRGLEKFQREFILQAVRALLEGREGDVKTLREKFSKALCEHQWDVGMFAKSETLKESPESYRKKIATSSRNRSAIYELALKSPHPMQAGDRVEYYITGQSKNVRAFEAAKLASEWDPNKRDENIAYYLVKLDDLYDSIFRPFLPPDTEDEFFLF